MRQLIAIGLVMLLGGCFPQAQAPTVAPTTAPSPTARSATITVEGEPTQVELEPYETPQFTVDLPADFVAVPDTNSGDGAGVRFKFAPTGTPDDQAYVQVFFPSETISADDLTKQLSASDGLLASNRWKVTQGDDAPPYDWARSTLNFEQPGSADAITGRIYVGEHQGKAFLVYTHFPIEYAEGFLPRADLILETFEPR